MKLTPAQIKQLRMIQGFRTTPPSVAWYFQVNWKTYAYLGALCIGSIVFLAWGGWPIASGFFAGFLFAAVVRDFKIFGTFVKAWPLSNEITNWSRVEELLSASEQAPPNNSLERTREG
jgi:hypothetical protein